MEENREAISVSAAAKMLGISRGLAYKAIRRGELPVFHVGRRLLVPLTTLKKMLSETDEDSDTEIEEHVNVVQ